MSFKIKLFYNESEPEKVSKSLTEKADLSCVLRDGCSLIDPVVILETTHEIISATNYVRIPQFNRYYYVNNIRSVRNGLYELSCHVDVLHTYRSEIKANKAIIHRSENNYELNFDDGSLKTFNNPKVTTKSFPNGLITTTEFVLAVAGGGGN